MHRACKRLGASESDASARKADDDIDICRHHLNIMYTHTETYFMYTHTETYIIYTLYIFVHYIHIRSIPYHSFIHLCLYVVHLCVPGRPQVPLRRDRDPLDSSTYFGDMSRASCWKQVTRRQAEYPLNCVTSPTFEGV